jgi:hypothetical protein
VSSTSSAAIRATTLPGRRPSHAARRPGGQAARRSSSACRSSPGGGGLQLRVQVVQVPAEPALQLGLDPDQVLAVIS